ncbi:uncharacterized protein EDB91DRAFT_1088440 [Suillus paluster]|uniref:uncharacterized protein n=1 Tax=Suillus paluster TaxID=48578 RepID=UPI001B877889|nr:uncharacterized protein EDB91DRAFT_1088440 [Suillus paluster]KAG1721475.1 hypothetical protein EDB91DRAFT_1088440 [Suillus paluster]
MGGPRVQEWTPTSNISVVEWKKTFRSRKATGKWVERPKFRKICSVTATPTKSPMKQPSQDMLYHGGEDYFEDMDQQNVLPLQLPKSLSQNDYLRQWVPRTKEYLNILIEWEAPASRSCIICGTDGVYKCHGCFRWNTAGFHFIASDYQGNDVENLFADYDTDNAEDADDLPGPTANATEQGEQPTGERTWIPNDLPTWVPFIKNSKKITTIVDKFRVHTHKIKYCMCADAPTADIQLCQMGLFPASFTQPKTAFTFEVLDNFLLDNLECGTSAMNYYNKLRRMTTSVFPHLVLDRYWEPMRVARQWRQLKLLKWNGFGHESKDRKPGDLALFCPAYPQPGINVTLPPEDEQGETNSQSELPKPSWLYFRSLVMDGNFKAEHLYAVNPMDEVSLMDGRAFMVGDATYKAHLAQAKDAIQRSECNNHRAVNQANVSWHRLEATGIGSCACARHGCFIPHAMVNFQKGERQMNMDYALCEALKHNAGGIRRALTFYDVNCQYHKYLRDRVSDSPFLELDQAMEIMLGIGLWHVHGHQDSCYVRYASNFITGATRIDSEIMETLWALLNIISPSARGMGTPHRKECLDYQMNDCNFMKMIRMNRQAVKGVTESTATFQKLNESTNPAKVIEWEEQERLAQQRHTINPKAMDIYEEQELQLLEVNGWRPGPAHQRGAATWLAEGLSIEEAQLTLQMDLRRLGRHPTESQRLDIARQRERLQGDIDQWLAQGLRFLGDGIGDGNIQPEKMVLPLPSTLGPEKCADLGAADLIHHELALREGQANDALHNIRVHLADKAVIFRTTVRTAKSQAMSTRAWAQVHSVDRVLANLGADDELLERYCPLLKEHLEVSTVVADPNARGQRNNTLAWFWSMDVEGDSHNSDWLNEFYHVHWLRAKALKDRWEEEYLLVQHEMNWTCNFFMYKAKVWIRLGAITQDKVGHVAYVARQCKMYQCLCQDAMDAFNKARDTTNRTAIVPKVE